MNISVLQGNSAKVCAPIRGTRSYYSTALDDASPIVPSRSTSNSHKRRRSGVGHRQASPRFWCVHSLSPPDSTYKASTGQSHTVTSCGGDMMVFYLVHRTYRTLDQRTVGWTFTKRSFSAATRTADNMDHYDASGPSLATITFESRVLHQIRPSRLCRCDEPLSWFLPLHPPWILEARVGSLFHSDGIAKGSFN